jgi:ADP-ribose pyrophosphatase YjhB (NUDIX family)
MMAAVTRTPEMHPVPVAVAAVSGPRGLLLLRRNRAPFEGMWALPGGKLRFGETPEAAALREVLEETGVTCRSRGVAAVVGEEYRVDGLLQLHYLIFLCRLAARTVRLRDSDEGEARWFTPVELKRERGAIVPSDRRMLGLLGGPVRPYYHCVMERRGERHTIWRFA